MMMSLSAEHNVNSLPGEVASSEPDEVIQIEGARVHNLKNVSLSIPRNALVVVTGLSGSGKSSLAFDVIYAEGQRRYMETLSAYARQFLGALERPDVDYVGGLAPVIAIEQRTTGRNSRSTVGTITEVYDFLRLLYARVSTAHSPVTGLPLVAHTDEEIVSQAEMAFSGRRVALCAPLVRGRKGHYESLFKTLLSSGFLHVRIDGGIEEIYPGMKLDRYAVHDVELVIDRFVFNEKGRERLAKSLPEAMRRGKDMVLIADMESGESRYYSRNLMCPTSGISLPSPEPHTFSFNSPYGECPACHGIGSRTGFTPESLTADPRKGVANGGIAQVIESKVRFEALLKLATSWLRSQKVNSATPIGEIPPEVYHRLFWGDEAATQDEAPSSGARKPSFRGFIPMLEEYYEHSKPSDIPEEIQARIVTMDCPECHGKRLRPESLCFRIGGLDIAEACEMSLGHFAQWIDTVEQSLQGAKRAVAAEIVKEIRSRVGFLTDVGLEYLSLGRAANTLSGGESQRIRLATQIGTQLVNVLYVLDEPSIGLHPRDNDRLIASLKQLRDIGNTVIVVEHDEDMMLSADHLVDLGPGAGRHGGCIMAQGTVEQIRASGSLTAQYLNGDRTIEVPTTRRPGSGSMLSILGASGNNLKGVDAHFPLGTFICVTGVSGSGKSSLINDTLYPIVSQALYHSLTPPLPYSKVLGLEYVDKVIQVDQSPLGRTPRSNPATYTGIFTDIRKLFAETPQAKMRGFKMGRFSFNVKGGRCETCKGAGVEVIEMNFLPDVHVQCSQCRGERYNRETLAVRYKGKSISQVLDMTVNQAAEFFQSVPTLLRKLEALQSVGMGYIKLGQSCTTLSGGESQRIRLASELGRKDSGTTLYILDEPTTGLHFEDIRLLLNVIHALVDRGNTVVVIEHNLDVIKCADYIIDLGPESGERGGEIVAAGTPEAIVDQGIGHTARYLAKLLHR